MLGQSGDEGVVIHPGAWAFFTQRLEEPAQKAAFSVLIRIQQGFEQALAALLGSGDLSLGGVLVITQQGEAFLFLNMTCDLSLALPPAQVTVFPKRLRHPQEVVV